MNIHRVRSVIFRYLTSADYFNIYKPSGTEIGGGGQAYIDFPIALISLKEWGKFFDGALSVYCDTGVQGPIWEFPIRSIGLSDDQEIKIYQRRTQSVCIASQRITSLRENRVKAWRPENGFPEPTNPESRNEVPNNLMIFIARTMKDEYWAGWSDNILSNLEKSLSLQLAGMENSKEGEGYAGYLEFNGNLGLNIDDIQHPFIV